MQAGLSWPIAGFWSQVPENIASSHDGRHEHINRKFRTKYIPHPYAAIRYCGRIRTGETAPHIENVDAWIYFTGRVENISYEETSLSIRLPYQGQISIQVSASCSETPQ